MLKMIPKCVTDESLKDLNWIEYPDDRLMSIHPSGFYIVVPKDCEPAVPIFCPVCDCALSTGEDVSACKELGCCEHCKDKWYYPNSVAWKDGWRPTEEIICDYKKTIIV